MQKLNRLFYWAEWQLLARLKKVYEPEFIGPYIPNTGIECPNKNQTGICRAHLTDCPELFAGYLHVPPKPYDRPMKLVRCGVCHWSDWREIGKEVKYSNGKDH